MAIPLADQKSTAQDPGFTSRIEPATVRAAFTQFTATPNSDATIQAQRVALGEGRHFLERGARRRVTQRLEPSFGFGSAHVDAERSPKGALGSGRTSDVLVEFQKVELSHGTSRRGGAR